MSGEGSTRPFTNWRNQIAVGLFEGPLAISIWRGENMKRDLESAVTINGIRSALEAEESSLTPESPDRPRMSLGFLAGDAVFLVSVSVTAVLLVHGAHFFVLNRLAAFALGMGLAMTAQYLLTALIAPILGSIESAVPSMLAAMAGSMTVCGLEALGLAMATSTVLSVGAAFGFATLAYIEFYASRCECKLRHYTQDGRQANE